MIKVAIVGYGNLGRGVELALKESLDLTLVGIFTRREPSQVSSVYGKVYSMEDLLTKKDEIDVCILCGGSATDLPTQTPELTKFFNTVDSFDTHALIPQHFERVNLSAEKTRHVSIISVGWDPGLFSLNRLLAEAILPVGETITFWGKGVSQGHSDALRRIEGVVDAIQYTVPNETAVNLFKSGKTTRLETREKHTRECFVVLADGVDSSQITEKIIHMPNYFEDYETTVTYVSQKELDKEHKQVMPHGGKVIRVGKTNRMNQETIEFSLSLASNPEFTASVLVAYARACALMAREGFIGAQTIFDVAPKYLTSFDDHYSRKTLL